MKKTITIKTECHCIQEHSKINKVLATVNAKNLAKLINVVGLTANPRKSKKGKITNAIQETLEYSPEDLRFKSKGILLSSSECLERDRGRFTLSFEDENYEGILDGGHNMLAAGLFILEKYFGEEDSIKQLRGVNNWDLFVEKWQEHEKDLSEILDAFEFEMSIEIIYPTDEYREAFPEKIFEISDARNNNVSLSSGTKADHKGYYEIIKNSLDNEIANKVEWKDGEKDKTIKRDDIVALSLVPLLALQKAKKLKPDVPQINPVNFYSSKGKCVEIFSLFFEKYSNKEGKITDELVLSAMKLIKNMPRLYDDIYQLFPDAYNSNSQGFGRISSVKMYDKGKKGPSHLTKSPLTKYYKEECTYKYPDGFIIPIVVGLHALMKVKNNKLIWKVDPYEFIKKNINEGIKMLVNTIKDNNWNPQSVGKSIGAYDSMEIMFEFLSKQFLPTT